MWNKLVGTSLNKVLLKQELNSPKLHRLVNNVILVSHQVSLLGNFLQIRLNSHGLASLKSFICSDIGCIAFGKVRNFAEALYFFGAQRESVVRRDEVRCWRGTVLCGKVVRKNKERSRSAVFFISQY